MARTADGTPSLPPELSESVQAMASVLLREESLPAVLELIAALSRATMRSIDAVSASLAPREKSRATTFGDDPIGTVLSDADSPVPEVLATGRSILIEAIDGDRRWDTFALAAAAQGIRSALILPLTVQDETIGTLNLFSHDQDAFDAEQLALGEEFASYASVLLANAQDYTGATQLSEHLREALKSRDLIGQAKGILMANRRCSPDEAFDLLREISQATNIKLREVARSVVETAQVNSDADPSPECDA